MQRSAAGERPPSRRRGGRAALPGSKRRTDPLGVRQLRLPMHSQNERTDPSSAPTHRAHQPIRRTDPSGAPTHVESGNSDCRCTVRTNTDPSGAPTHRARRPIGRADPIWSPANPIAGANGVRFFVVGVPVQHGPRGFDPSVHSPSRCTGNRSCRTPQRPVRRITTARHPRAAPTHRAHRPIWSPATPIAGAERAHQPRWSPATLAVGRCWTPHAGLPGGCGVGAGRGRGAGGSQ